MVSINNGSLFALLHWCINISFSIHKLTKLECYTRTSRMYDETHQVSMAQEKNTVSIITVPCSLLFICASISAEVSRNWLNQSAENVKQVWPRQVSIAKITEYGLYVFALLHLCIKIRWSIQKLANVNLARTMKLTKFHYITQTTEYCFYLLVWSLALVHQYQPRHPETEWIGVLNM